MSLSSQQVVDTADGLLGLVNILSNQGAFESKAQELKDLATAGNIAFQKAEDSRIEASKLLEETAAKTSEALELKTTYEDKLASFTKDTEEKETMLQNRELDVSARENNVLYREQRVSEKEFLSSTRESESVRRLQEAKDLQEALSKNLADAEISKDTYEKLITKVKASLV